MTIKKGDWIKVMKTGYIMRDFFFIAKIESLMGSLEGPRINAKYFIRDDCGRFDHVPVYIHPGESSYFSIKRKAYSNEIFSSITNFKVSPISLK